MSRWVKRVVQRAPRTSGSVAQQVAGLHQQVVELEPAVAPPLGRRRRRVNRRTRSSRWSSDALGGPSASVARRGSASAAVGTDARRTRRVQLALPALRAPSAGRVDCSSCEDLERRRRPRRSRSAHAARGRGGRAAGRSGRRSSRRAPGRGRRRRRTRPGVDRHRLGRPVGQRRGRRRGPSCRGSSSGDGAQAVEADAGRERRAAGPRSASGSSSSSSRNAPHRSSNAEADAISSRTSIVGAAPPRTGARRGSAGRRRAAWRWRRRRPRPAALDGGTDAGGRPPPRAAARTRSRSSRGRRLGERDGGDARASATPVATSSTMRPTSAVVLPVPAPASTNSVRVEVVTDRVAVGRSAGHRAGVRAVALIPSLRPSARRRRPVLGSASPSASAT